ncbi:MAG: hypothetical protein U5J82_12215 [Desulfobacterales bacterium]|nr:hypothetical protein [Desulfobacterales bacterium]
MAVLLEVLRLAAKPASAAPNAFAFARIRDAAFRPLWVRILRSLLPHDARSCAAAHQRILTFAIGAKTSVEKSAGK